MAANLHFFCFPIKTLDGYEHVNVDVFLKTSDDMFVKISPDGETIPEVLKKYNDDEKVELMVKAADQDELFVFIRGKMLSFIEGTLDLENFEESVDLLSTSHRVLKTLIKKNIIDEASKEIVNGIVKNSMGLSKSDKVRQLMDSFKMNCKEEYTKSLAVSYFCNSMAKTFSWHTQGMLEKLTQAAMLADITLSTEDFDEIEEKPMSDWSKRILNHPIDASVMVSQKSNIVDPETAKIISFHHELPDGSGYPKKVTAGAMSPLCAIYIVGNYFIEMLVEKDHYGRQDSSQEEIKKILFEMKKIFSNSNNFKNAFHSLVQVMHFDEKDVA
jgi:HD-GYP domain-containing protein (c-di-GMP phosphodiesterase class II)